MSAAPVRIGIVGCGMVAAEYADTFASSDRVQVTACADRDADRAADFARRFGIRSLTVGDLLAPAIDLAVILSPPGTHAALAGQAIAAGVPAVWIEKPIAVDPDDAARLIANAAQAGIILGSAPDTVLGPALLTAASALQHGLIGDIRSAAAALYSTGPERWHPSPEPFYAEHAGPLGDMGPYYLTALDHLLGPMHVRASIARTRPERRIRSDPRAGTAFTAQAPTFVAALLETDTGIPVTLATSFDAAGTRAPHLEIHGTEGTLVLPDPNFHDGDVLHRPYDAHTWSVVPTKTAVDPVGRGMGCIDLAEAMREGRSARCCARRAERVARLSQAIIANAATASPIPAQTTPGTPSTIR
jgi:predicted dehydrogenase